MASPKKKTTRSRSKRKKKTPSIWENRQFHRLGGFVALFMGLYLIIAYISYIFTWDLDQNFFFGPQQTNHYWKFIFSKAEVANQLGRIGSLVSHLSFYNIGLASFLIPLVLIAAGFRLLLPRKLFSLMRVLQYSFIGVIVFSVTLSFFFGHGNYFYGGLFGNHISNWLERFIGSTGAGLLATFSTFVFLVFVFNYNMDNFFESIFRLGKVKPGKPDLSFISKLKGSLPEEEKKRSYKRKTIKDKEDELEPTDAQGSFSFTKKIRSALANSPLGETINFELGKKESKPAKTGPSNFTQDRNKDFEDDIDLNAPIDLDAKPKSKTTKLTKPAIAVGGKDGKDGLILDVEMPQESVSDVLNELANDKKEATPVIIEQGDYDPTADLSNYKVPPLDLLEFYGNDQIDINRAELEKNKERIVETLSNYNIEIEKIRATPGATITLYEIVPAPGIRISKIKGLVDDIALSLAALGIRIIAPIPGRGTIGIEIPNDKKQIVPLRELLASDQFQKTTMELPVAIGTGIRNKVFVADLAKMPHLLMAGATGQGKSVCINTILVSLLYKKHPSEMKFILVDPKKVELSIYEKIQNHFLASLPDEEEAIVTDTRKVVYTLNAMCIEMDNRYNLLKAAHVRNVKEYNRKFIKRKLNPEKGHQFLPYLVLVIDEFADLIMTAGKEVEVPLTRLAQLARAVGIHLIIATQRPTVNIITGTIKANFPVRLALRVSSKVDSRTIIDMGGAEQLIGRGDMIFVQGADSYRLQGALVDTPEVDRVANYIGEQHGFPGPFALPEFVDEKEAKKGGKQDIKLDKLFVDAARLIVGAQSGSTSLIQRKMSLGYNRAGRIMDQLEAYGIVGPAQGSKPRDVHVHDFTQLEEMITLNGWG